MENRSKLFLLIGMFAFIIIGATFYIAIKPKDKDDVLSAYNKNYTLIHGSVHQLVTEK